MIEILLLFHFNKKRNHSQFAVCLKFLFVFSFGLHHTKHISNRGGVCCAVRPRRKDFFFNFALPLTDIGALYVREMTISTLTNNYKEFFFFFKLLPNSNSIKFLFRRLVSVYLKCLDKSEHTQRCQKLEKSF